jgi:hypothetical protein
VVLGAALLLPVGSTTGERSRAKRVLEQAGADDAVVRQVAEILDAFHAGQTLQSTEFLVVRDADTLVALADRDPAAEDVAAGLAIEDRLTTEAGKAKARSISS